MPEITLPEPLASRRRAWAEDLNERIAWWRLQRDIETGMVMAALKLMGREVDKTFR